MKKSTIAFLFNDKDQILLCMKKRGFGVGKWNGAGGKLMEGETVIDAAIRELFEETSIKLDKKDLTERGVLSFFWDGKEEWNQDTYIFVGKYEGDYSESEEMRPQWFDIAEIPYEEMWEDDKYWLPLLLNTDKYIKFHAFFDKAGQLSRHEFLS